MLKKISVPKSFSSRKNLVLIATSLLVAAALFDFTLVSCRAGGLTTITPVSMPCAPQVTKSELIAQPAKRTGQIRKKIEVEIPVENSKPLSKSWIGIDCCETSPILRSHLGLNTGLAIIDLAEDSPAAIAGLKPFDILLRLDSRTLTDMNQLSRLVDRCDEQVVFVDIIRRGMKMRLPITPAARPQCKSHSIVVVADEKGEFDYHAARIKMADLINNREPGEPLQKFELILVKRPVVYRTDERAAEASVEKFGKTHRISSHEYELWDQTDRREVEWVRLRADLDQRLAMLRQMEDELSAEKQRFEALIDQTKRQQANTARMLELQLRQMNNRFDFELFVELVEQRRAVEESLLKWEQMIDRLKCYRGALDCNSCDINGKKTNASGSSRSIGK